MRLTTTILALPLVACSALPVAAADLGPGWRTGTVLAAGPSSTIGPLVGNDCRRTLEVAPDSDRLFASVQYFSGRHAHVRVVPMAEDAKAAAGDTVHVNLDDCRKTLVP